MEKIFQTRIPLRKDFTLEKLIQESVLWICDNPNNDFQVRKDIFNHDFSLTPTFESNTYSFQTTKLKNENDSAFGIKFSKPLGIDGKINYEIAVVVKDTSQCYITTTRESNSIRPTDESLFIKPSIVNNLIKFSSGNDGIIPFQERGRFHMISNDETVEASTIINGAGGNLLPIVYISKEMQTEFEKINPKYLANALSGIAHVFLERNSLTGKRVMSYVKDQTNTCQNGDIRIYWPGARYSSDNQLIAFGQEDIIDNYTKQKKTPDITKKITEYIIKNFVRVNFGKYSSFEKIQSAAKLEELINDKDNADPKELVNALLTEKQELEELLQMAGDETNEEKDKQHKLSLELNQLRAKYVGLAQRNTLEDTPYSFSINHPNPAEIKDSKALIVQALIKSRQNYHENSRIYNLIDNVAKTNQEDTEKFQASTEDFFQKLKPLLKASKGGMTQEIESLLIDNGFKVKLDGSNHYRVFRDGEEEVFINFYGTGSKSRNGENLFSKFTNKFF